MEDLEWGDHLIVGDSTKVGATKNRARGKTGGSSSKAPAEAPAAKRPRRDLAQPVPKPVRPPKADALKEEFLKLLDDLGKGQFTRKPVLPFLLKNDPIRLGSDCAGYCSEAMALEQCGVKFEQTFICEADRKTRHLNYLLHGTKIKYYKDIRSRIQESTPRVHVYAFGPPCQGLSGAWMRVPMCVPRSWARVPGCALRLHAVESIANCIDAQAAFPTHRRDCLIPACVGLGAR